MLDRPSDGAGSVEAVFMALPRLVSGQPLPMQDELFLRDGEPHRRWFEVGEEELEQRKIAQFRTK